MAKSLELLSIKVLVNIQRKTTKKQRVQSNKGSIKTKKPSKLLNFVNSPSFSTMYILLGPEL